jgi:hypothetical protein
MNGWVMELRMWPYRWSMLGMGLNTGGFSGLEVAAVEEAPGRMYFREDIRIPHKTPHCLQRRPYRPSEKKYYFVASRSFVFLTLLLCVSQRLTFIYQSMCSTTSIVPFDAMTIENTTTRPWSWLRHYRAGDKLLRPVLVGTGDWLRMTDLPQWRGSEGQQGCIQVSGNSEEWEQYFRGQEWWWAVCNVRARIW